MFDEIQSYILFFLGTWWIALIALIGGAIGGRHSKRYFPALPNMLIVFVEVWVIVAVAKLAFGYVGYMMQLRETVQIIYPEFAMPLFAGAYAARQLLKLDAQKTARRLPGAR